MVRDGLRSHHHEGGRHKPPPKPGRLLGNGSGYDGRFSITVVGPGFSPALVRDARGPVCVKGWLLCSPPATKRRSFARSLELEKRGLCFRNRPHVLLYRADPPRICENGVAFASALGKPAPERREARALDLSGRFGAFGGAFLCFGSKSQSSASSLWRAGKYLGGNSFSCRRDRSCWVAD